MLSGCGFEGFICSITLSCLSSLDVSPLFSFCVREWKAFLISNTNKFPHIKYLNILYRDPRETLWASMCE